jgi:hypothetical protein
VDKFIGTYTLDTTTPDLLRELLLSECNLVKSVIGTEFPEFYQRDGKDLSIKFIIGDQSARQFASCSSGSFSFTDDFYSFRKEKENNTADTRPEKNLIALSCVPALFVLREKEVRDMRMLADRLHLRKR